MPDALTAQGFDWPAWVVCLGFIVLFATAGWLVSLWRRDVSIVDSMWSLMFLLALLVYLAQSDNIGWRAVLVLVLVSVWAIRLSVHITWRNRGQAEDRRYQAIRRNNEPHFEFKSLYLVFGLQGLLAWIICLPVLAAAGSQLPMNLLDLAGTVLWLAGMIFESVGDAQLARFISRPGNQGKVLDTGLWRYTRHPNYFGEFLLWWGFYLLALGSGGGWTVLSPVLMSFLLLRVSGVTLLERDIGQRRPAYHEYMGRTNAFFPGKPRVLKEKPAGVAR